ncbi:sucrose-phosphate phosphatase [Pantanalinema rosaneae CENA516]|uniref:sucrose-phosphate phosphatase n=1 Tax=Pantanalinema rosaneae TaxID=1620701 RepID=UPI003D700265
MSSFLLVTDLDNTLVGDDQAMLELNQRLSHHRQHYGSKIVYSTGRSPIRYQELATEKPLLEPDILIAAVGTEIYVNGSDRPDPNWAGILSQAWDREQIVATTAHIADLTPQAETEQRPFKVSYFLSPSAAIEVIPRLETLLAKQGLEVQLIYSGSQDLDILPRRANKGMAMAFVRQDLGIAPTQTVACGDSGNDIALFADRPERGIIVGNAMSELLDWHHANPNPDRYLATAHCAGGILEGLNHFGLL